MKININHIMEGIKNTVFVKEEVEKIASERLKICKGCPFYSKNIPDMARPDAHCTDCDCNLHLKTRALAAACPRGNWPAVATPDQADQIEQACS